MRDKFKIPFKNGDVVNINQTVNGCCLFVILTLDPLDIRYAHDLTYQYQYDKLELLGQDTIFESDVEIVGNIYNFLKTL